MALKIKESNALVNAASQEWRRLSDANRALEGRWHELSDALAAAHRGECDNPFTLFSANMAPEPKKAKPAELTQREHEVWLSAYSFAHGEPATGPGKTRGEVAMKAAREAVDAYRHLVNGEPTATKP